MSCNHARSIDPLQIQILKCFNSNIGGIEYKIERLEVVHEITHH